MKILGIDYGQKRIGTAIGSTSVGIAFPRVAISKSTDAILFSTLKKMCEIEAVEKLVVGKPLLMDGGSDAQTKSTITFGEKASKLLSIPVVFVDERLTTKAVETDARFLSKKGLREKRDPFAAQKILQTWFDQKNV